MAFPHRKLLLSLVFFFKLPSVRHCQGREILIKVCKNSSRCVSEVCKVV
jgi:hypothetical protein